MSSNSNSRIVWFDALRGLSSLAVCAGHLRAVFFCDYAEIAYKQFWHLPFYFSTGLGHQAVVVFFVLSGFLVGGSAIRNRHDFSWVSYGLARLSRLWVVLIPALVFTLLVDTFVSHLSPEAVLGGFRAAWNSGPTADTYSASPTTFVGNMFFLQTILTPEYGSNGPLWSLANEFWYYVLFPLLIGVFFGKSFVTKIVSGLVGLGISLMLPTGILLGGVIWSLGALVYFLSKQAAIKPVRFGLIGICFVTFIAGLVCSKSPRLEQLLPIPIDFVVAITVAALAATVSNIVANEKNFLDRMARRLSDSSYTLYLFHFPVVFALGSLLLKENSLQPSVLNLGLYFVTLTALVGFGHAVWYLFERRTDDIRRWLAKRLISPE